MIFPGCGVFETRSASGGHGAVLVANSTLPVINGVSVLVIGNWLGPRISKLDDNYVNANGGIFLVFCVMADAVP